MKDPRTQPGHRASSMRRIILRIAPAFCILTAACAPTTHTEHVGNGEGPLMDKPSTITAAFVCNAGKTINATFINGVQGSVRLALSDGRELVLPQAMSGSGARYANSDESFVFWNKGNTAFIAENGRTTYEGCTGKP